MRDSYANMFFYEHNDINSFIKCRNFTTIELKKILKILFIKMHLIPVYCNKVSRRWSSSKNKLRWGAQTQRVTCLLNSLPSVYREQPRGTNVWAIRTHPNITSNNLCLNLCLFSQDFVITICYKNNYFYVKLWTKIWFLKTVLRVRIIKVFFFCNEFCFSRDCFCG